jgi:hypothetical protein
MRALILSGFGSIPFVEAKQPRTFPFVIPNLHFSGLSLSHFTHVCEGFNKVKDVSFLLSTGYDYVIDVG